VPPWSRDGRWLFFSSDRNGGRNIWRMPWPSGPAEQVTTGGSGSRAVMSPDGEDVYYAAHSGAAAPLLAITAGGGAVSRVVVPCTRGYATTAEALYYIGCGPGPEYDVHFVEARTQRDRVLGRTRLTGWGSPLTVSPDGTTVLVLRDNSTTDLVLIENFR
jgi:hypothetical protein